MPNSNKAKVPSITDSLASGEPVTHFFYEYRGERAVDPFMLIDSAITLWHENIYSNDTHDNSYLWGLAESIVKDRRDTPIYSWVEWTRYQITTGALVPEQWGNKRPYPYKGLFISAIYLHEAMRLCEGGQVDRAWHIIAIAYYHLGLNTASSTLKNTSRAAQVMHAGRTDKIRALVIAALNKLRTNGSARSMENAKDLVVDMIREKAGTSPVRDWLAEFDAMVPASTKGRTEARKKNDVLVRLRNMLDDWALPTGPYPDVAEAFSQFNKRKTCKKPLNEDYRTTSAGIPIDEPDYDLRLVNFFDDGEMLTIKLSRRDSST